MSYTQWLDQRTFLTSASRTTTQTQADQANLNYKGIIVFTNVTNVGTGSITPSIQGYDVPSATWVTLLAGAAIITNISQTLFLYPASPVTANVSANMALWPKYRLLITANNANAVVYSVGFILVP